MKTIIALVFSILLTNTFCVRMKQFLGDQIGKGIGVQAVGAAQCGKDIGVQSLGVGVDQFGKGIGAGQWGIGAGLASPLNYGWAGNSYPWGGVGYGAGYGIGRGWGNYGGGYGIGKGVGVGQFGGKGIAK